MAPLLLQQYLPKRTLMNAEEAPVAPRSTYYWCLFGVSTSASLVETHGYGGGRLKHTCDALLERARSYPSSASRSAGSRSR